MNPSPYRSLRHTLMLAVSAAFVALAGCGAMSAQNPSGALRPVNAVSEGPDERLMLKGAGAVTYFTDGRHAQGKPEHKSLYEGVTFRFASADHKALFDKEKSSWHAPSDPPQTRAVDWAVHSASAKPQKPPPDATKIASGGGFADGAGFEPAEGCPSLAYQTSALSHSTNHGEARLANFAMSGVENEILVAKSMPHFAVACGAASHREAAPLQRIAGHCPNGQVGNAACLARILTGTAWAQRGHRRATKQNADHRVGVRHSFSCCCCCC